MDLQRHTHTHMEELTHLEQLTADITVVSMDSASEVLLWVLLAAGYCWSKKSSTSWYGRYPIICTVLYIPGGRLRFLYHQPYLYSQWLKNLNSSTGWKKHPSTTKVSSARMFEPYRIVVIFELWSDQTMIKPTNPRYIHTVDGSEILYQGITRAGHAGHAEKRSKTYAQKLGKFHCPVTFRSSCSWCWLFFLLLAASVINKTSIAFS